MSKKVEPIDELNVKRINIVDEDGTLRMAISNKERFPAPLLLEGKEAPREGLPKAGIIFYNDEGIECGGLTYASNKGEKGEIETSVLLSFDPYLQNDVIDLGLWEKDGEKAMFLTINDRPNTLLTDFIKEHEHMIFAEDSVERDAYINDLHKKGELGFERIQLMKTMSGEAVVRLSDSKGRPRIRLRVDKNDIPKLEFLDEDGQVVYSLPPEK